MQARIKRISFVVLGLIVLTLLLVWLFLSSSFLAGPRGDLAARYLTNKLGQDVTINGGLQLEIGAILHISAKDLSLPGPRENDPGLVEVGSLDFDLAVSDLRSGLFHPRNIAADGTRITLVEDTDGAKTWASQSSEIQQNNSSEPDRATTAEQATTKTDKNRLLAFLTGNQVQFANSAVSYRSARNGFELDLVLDSLTLGQTAALEPVLFQGTGALNGQDLSLEGRFPKGEPFRVSASLDQIKASLEGAPEDAGGHTTQITLDVANLGQLQDVLKLEKAQEGKGRVTAVLKTSGSGARVDDLDVEVTLDTGQSVSVTGDIGELGNPADVTLYTNIRLYADDNLPPPTNSRLNLKLVGVVMELIAQPSGIPKRGMVIETNGFVLDTSGEGPPPIAVSGISRTADSHLRLGKVELRIGPPDAPFLILNGPIENALRFEQIDLKGTLDIPAGSLVAPELFQASGALGHVTGGFRLAGDLVKLGLSDLQAASHGTELWHLDITGSVENTLKFSNVDLHVAADIPSSADLLEVMGLDPIETGSVKLKTDVSSQGTKWLAKASVTVAESQLDLTVDLDLAEPHPVVRGQIESDLIKIDHIRDIVATTIQLNKLNKTKKNADAQDAPPEDRPDAEPEYQPLVLTAPTTSENAVPSDPPGPFRNVTLRPLGRSILLSGMDLNTTIDLRKIDGDKGTTSLKTDLELRDQKARLGPVKFEYGGGNFDVSGAMDLVENPDIVSLSGSTGGWNFAEILQELNFKKRASGVLYANFDVSGGHKSIDEFFDTLKGAATITMRNGSIDSQLLNLAGLGVVPWLFSKTPGKTAKIVCIRAPLYISNGRISSKQAVVETQEVQIVVFGNVDLKHNTLDISGQPRRIGKPLARSPWPFTVQGSMSNPNVKVKDGPRKLRRSDGASTMPQKRKPCVPDILQLK